MDEQRKIIAIPEPNEKIEKIKQKYGNLEMNDKTASKIRKLEITNKILKAVTAVVGIATTVNYFVPDMLPFVDEALLTGVTALLGTSTKIVENKIEDLANSGQTQMQKDEINGLASDFMNVVTNIKNKKNKGITV